MREVGYVRRDLGDCYKILEGTMRFVCVEIGGVKIGGIYRSCGEGVHDMWRWLNNIPEVVSGSRWLLVGE